MPKGGIKPRNSDGSTEHLFHSKWRSGKTQTIRVPIALSQEVMTIAQAMDKGNYVFVKDGIVVCHEKNTEGAVDEILRRTHEIALKDKQLQQLRHENDQLREKNAQLSVFAQIKSQELNLKEQLPMEETKKPSSVVCCNKIHLIDGEKGGKLQSL